MKRSFYKLFQNLIYWKQPLLKISYSINSIPVSDQPLNSYTADTEACFIVLYCNSSPTGKRPKSYWSASSQNLPCSCRRPANPR